MLHLEYSNRFNGFLHGAASLISVKSHRPVPGVLCCRVPYCTTKVLVFKLWSKKPDEGKAVLEPGQGHLNVKHFLDELQ
jgi:hypothetical protein